MLVFLNGQFVPEAQAVVSVFDRSFLYGDGLFETLRVRGGRPFRWKQHLDRLRRGAEFLNIHLPFAAEALRGFADELIARNRMPDALLRLTLSRGVGVRGYSPRGADHPALVMSLHAFSSCPSPAGGGEGVGREDAREAQSWKLITASVRLPAGEALAQFKTCNKLPQILARAEADAAGADEALLLNTDGFVVEATSSNLFWIDGETVCTPPLASGILAGVTRAVVLEICGSLGVAHREGSVTPEQLRQVSGVFVSLSSWGVVDADSLDGRELRQAAIVRIIRQAYEKALLAETA